MSDPRLGVLELQAAAKRMRVENTLDEVKRALGPERMAMQLLRSQPSRAGMRANGRRPDTAGLVKACVIVCAALVLIEIYRRRKLTVQPSERKERPRIVHLKEV